VALSVELSYSNTNVARMQIQIEGLQFDVVFFIGYTVQLDIRRKT